MRKALEVQLRLDIPKLNEIAFDLASRHELERILMGLRYLYDRPQLLRQILDLIAQDVNRHRCAKNGAPGLAYWEILVLASVRLGCDLDFDALADLANNHRKLRAMLHVGDWEEGRRFPRSTIHSNLMLLSAETIRQISNLICAEGHQLAPEAIERVRGDSVVVQTNIHYPTDASLLVDAVRKVLSLSSRVGQLFSSRAWQNWRRELKIARALCRTIGRIAAKRGLNTTEKQDELKTPYAQLIDHVSRIALKAADFKDNLDLDNLPAEGNKKKINRLIAQLEYYLAACATVTWQAERRVLHGESLSNREKVFSIFEPHTELINRGKSPFPLEFGHRVLFIEDRAGFIVDYRVMNQGQTDDNVVVPVMRELQERMRGRIQTASFDMGFWSPNNLKELSKIVAVACLPQKGRLSSEAQLRESAPAFRLARRWHPGIESAIHALVAANGLAVCRDKDELGYHRYVALGVLGRNLHTLGAILFEQERTKRQRFRSAA